MATAMDERAPSPLPPLGHDISRSSSTSTQSSKHLNLPQYPQQQHNPNNIALPGLSALVSAAASPNLQSRSYNGVGPSINYSTASPTPTSVSGQGNNPNLQPVCQNCATLTTPLWRRDEIGSVLCNACGLFLKLHGRPRPISLKTDVIKSRNRVKSAGHSQKKKSLPDSNGIHVTQPEGTPPPNHLNHRRVSHKMSSGDSDRSNSPISRTMTPSIHPSNIAPQHMFDASLIDHGYGHSPSLPALHLRHPSPGSTTSLNDRHLEPPASYESLQQLNTTLKTRVSELEVINDLFRGRVAELEQNHQRREMAESQLRQALDQAAVRENEMKRRFDDLQHQVAHLRHSRSHSPPPAKRPRLSDTSEYPDPPEPPTVTL